MSTILDTYRPQPMVDESMQSENSRDFVKIVMLQEELEREKERLFLGLSPREKREAFRVLSKQYNIPEFVTVKDVSEILGITPQMVRRHCSDGRIIALQTLEGSGKWRIQTEQFMDHPNWDKFLEKRVKIKKQSINIAEKMLEYLDDVE